MLRLGKPFIVKAFSFIGLGDAAPNSVSALLTTLHGHVEQMDAWPAAGPAQ